MRWWQGILLYITMLYIGGPLFIIFPMPGGIYNDIIIRLVTLVIAAIFLLPNPYACRTLFRLRRPLLGWTLAIAAGLTMRFRGPNTCLRCWNTVPRWVPRSAFCS